MGNPHTNKRERGHKRSNTQVEVEKAKKKKLLNSKAAPILVHIPIGDVSEEEEEEIPSGKLAFDTLLKILGSGSDEKLTKLYERRQREQEGISDSEEDDDDGSEKENGGLGSESDMDDVEDGDLREHAPYTINEQDEDETSSEDDAGSASNKEINTDDLIRTSSFHRHLEHILTNEDADKLMESELKYKWEIAAPNMSTKWVGTNEHLTKDLGGDVVHGLNKKLYKHWQKTYGASDFAGLNSQLKFYFSLCKKMFQFIAEEGVGHKLTVSMVQEASNWFDKFLK